MQLDFFPSRTLTFYLARLFFTRIVAMLFVLVLVLMMLDLLGTSGDILAVPGNGQAEVLHYAMLRIPQLIARFLPYAVLLATIITLIALNQNSEVVAMKAAGLSAHQVLAPLLLTAALFSAGSFLFNERVVTRATATLSAWEANDYAPVAAGSEVRTHVYLADGPNILYAQSITGTGDAMRMTGVTWYERTAQGMLVREVRAPRAHYTGAGWQLQDARIFDVASARTALARTMVVAPGLTPTEAALGKVDAESIPFWRLKPVIDTLEGAGRRTAELRAQWWHKLSGPLSAFLMPLLGAVAAFGLARSGQLFVRAIVGMALGFAYFVVDNAALAMGSFGGYPPFLAAWAPFVLFLFIGEAVLIRTEE